MAKSIMDRDNQHLLLEHIDNSGNSFIANVNLLAHRYDTLAKLTELFDAEKIKNLILVSKVNVDKLIDDLEKGTYNGFRKLDINLLKNFYDYSEELTDNEKVTLWNDPTKRIYYSGITVYFNDKTSIYTEFTEKGVSTPIWNHHQLYAYLLDWTEFRTKYGYTMFDIASTGISTLELVRIWDGEDSGSNIEKIVLHVASKGENQAYDSFYAKAKSYSPIYTWIDTTSVLIAIANQYNNLLKISRNIGDILEVCAYLPELDKIHSVLDYLVSTDSSKDTIFKYLDSIITVYNKLDVLESVKDTDKVLQDTKVKLEEIKKALEDKANLIRIDKVVYVVDSFDIVSNYTNDYHLGDVLTCGNLTFTVTETDEEGRITNGTISPQPTPVDYTGYWEFIEDNIFSIDIHYIPQNTNQKIVLDLSDVRDELSLRLDATAKGITSIAHKLAMLEEMAKHEDLADAMEELELALADKLDITVFLDYVNLMNDRIEALEDEENEHIDAVAEAINVQSPIINTTLTEKFDALIKAIGDSDKVSSDTVKTELQAITKAINDKVIDYSKIENELTKIAKAITDKDFKELNAELKIDFNNVCLKFDELTTALSTKEVDTTAIVNEIANLTKVIANNQLENKQECFSSFGLFVLGVDTNGYLYAEEAGLTGITWNITENGVLEGEYNG